MFEALWPAWSVLQGFHVLAARWQPYATCEQMSVTVLHNILLTRQGTGWIWPVGQSLLTFAVDASPLRKGR